VAPGIVLAAAVLALLIYRQLIPRPVSASTLRLLVILGVVGVLQTAQFLAHDHSGALTYAAVAGSLLLAAVFGALRAATVSIWLTGGQAWSKGTWLTACLWVAALAAHLGYDALIAHGHGDSGLGTATVVLYLAVSLAFQRVIVLARAHRPRAGLMGPGPAAPAGLFPADAGPAARSRARSAAGRTHRSPR
jgi:hypothetical protein